MKTQRQQIKAALAKGMESKYRIAFNRGSVSIHNPAYVNIEYDNEFKVEDGDAAIRIYNSKVIVSLWKNPLIEHITIL